MSQAVVRTLLGAAVPGLGFIMGGRKRLGVAVLSVAVGLVAIAGIVAVTDPNAVLALAVSPGRLLIATSAVVLLGLGWIWVVVASHKLLRPVSVSYTGRLAGSLFVGVLCFAIAVPTTFAAETVMAQRDLVGSVFKSESNSKSATRPTNVNASDPWAHTPRLNVLLLGGDSGKGRTGTRTDTVMVASIDTRTGNTALISLSRNWMRMPFPKNSPLHAKYPDGYWDPSLGDVEQSQYYLDTMYDTIPQKYPGILGQTDNEGADAVKLAASAALGLDISYYLQINLQGFQQIIDAVGGITVNINYRVPIGGEYGLGPGANKPKPPSGYLEPGPNQHLNGHDALWFARGRYGLSDPSRQERQRCTIHALVNQVSPVTLLTKYQQIAAAGKSLFRTDVPQELLPAFVQLGLKVKSAAVSNIDLNSAKNFPNGRNPDYAAMRVIIQKAITAQATTKPAHSPAKRPSAPATRKATPKPSVTPGGQQNLNDACAYHPSTAGS
ncbi:LCP family protein [Kribbella sp.]|uniref:LCP family protein n=1 Tax=Kribbella sp. TaxID=1871183 RepID=UPI002D4838B8|nr:LCP family protein [Kribbella sp.]HZX03398.1 LCP family protein [Kribbella sp.]